jgi:hypothetical protein
MRSAMLMKTIGIGLMVCGLMFVHPFSAAAQESPPARQDKPGGKMGRPGMMGHEQRPGMMAEMQKMHEHMEGMHQEMTQELQKQLTALREHAKAMDGISDEKQLLTEMKKHQQMTDDFLGTMIEQHEKMHARMKERHKQMPSRMGKKPQTETQESEGHEAHHEGE